MKFFFCLLTIIFHSITSANADTKQLFLDAKKNNFQSHRFDHLISEYPIYRKKPFSCISTEYRKNCYNVLVVDHAKIPVTFQNIYLKSIKLNAIAVPPNLIIIDDHLLDKIYISAWTIKLAMFSTVNAHIMFPLASQQYLAYLRRTISKDKDLLDANWTNIREKVDQLNSEKGNINSNAYMSTTLSFLIEHEISHLASNASIVSRTLNKFKYLFDENSILSEERNADKEAIPNSNRQFVELARNWALSMPDLSSFAVLEANQNLFFTHILGYAQMLRDDLLFEAFNGFRGWRVEDYFVNLFYKRCADRDRDQHVAYGRPKDIRGAVFWRLPNLTKLEFQEVRKSLLGNVVGSADSVYRTATHDHHLIRYQNIIDFVEKTEKRELSRSLRIADWRSIFRSIAENNPTIMHEQYNTLYTGSIKGVHPDDIKEVFEYHDIEEAVTCPKGRCFTTNLNGKGFAEWILNSDSDLNMVKMFVELPRNDSVKTEGSIEYISKMIFAVGGTDQEGFEFYKHLSQEIARCGFGTVMMDWENVRVFVTSLNDRGDTFVWFFSKDAF